MTDPVHEPMFAALCKEVGICLHPKGEKRVLEALPNGLDAAVKAVFAAEGIDLPSAPGPLKRSVRDCLKAHLPDWVRRDPAGRSWVRRRGA